MNVAQSISSVSVKCELSVDSLWKDSSAFLAFRLTKGVLSSARRFGPFTTFRWKHSRVKFSTSSFSVVFSETFLRNLFSRLAMFFRSGLETNAGWEKSQFVQFINFLCCENQLISTAILNDYKIMAISILVSARNRWFALFELTNHNKSLSLTLHFLVLRLVTLNNTNQQFRTRLSICLPTKFVYLVSKCNVVFL